MAAPDFIPTDPSQSVRSYSSPPWRPRSWFADRPGEIGGQQPVGEQLGSPGPDQGYALSLAARFGGRLELAEGENEADALTGATAVAMKRSALFGRGPIIHDLTVGLTVWGFLNPAAPADLVEVRREWFEEVHLSIHYTELRRIVDAVAEPVLRGTPEQVTRSHLADWRSCLDLSGASVGESAVDRGVH
jgi:hypothetical protein